MSPDSRVVALRGLRHRVLTWEPPSDVEASGLTVLLVHGFADAAGSFDLLAPLLTRAGHVVVAPDLRGFGETSWVGDGGYYHFFDYVGDLDGLVGVLAPPKLAVVGHSMGGTISTLFSGARPSLVHRLALLEGFGPPDNDVRYAPDRATKWLDDMRKDGGRSGQKAFASMDEAIKRLAVMHAKVPRELLATRAAHLVKENADGTLSWRFDPMHRTTSPQPFYADTYKAFARRVTCPVLAVSGGPEGFHPPDEEDRLTAFARLTKHDLPDAGHMMHWTKPRELADQLLAFLRD
jgi:pimeloyl-ACP methyl ester carboxylesterase